MNHTDILSHLESLEAAFLSSLQEVRTIKAEIHKQSDNNLSLEPLLEAEEVARILGVDTGYIYSQARANKIPSLKFGKYRKFSPSQIKKWLDRKNSP